MLGAALAPISRGLIAIPLGFACLFLMIGWRVGPQRMIDAARLRKLTAHAEGRIVESWMALDWDPSSMGAHHLWRPLTKASLCVVVEYEAGWTSALRRAFCSSQGPYNTSIPLSEIRSMSPDVPFVWARDSSGFAVPEIRISRETRAWLASHPEPDPLPNDPPTKTALESLRLNVDQPVAFAVAGWTRHAATIPLSFDPHDPRGALPAGFITEKLDLPPTPVLFLMFPVMLAPGVALWFFALPLMLGPMRRGGFWIVAMAPLLLLPWWGEQVPRYIAKMNWRVGEVMTVFLSDLDRRGSMVSSTPEEADLARGERLVWRWNEGLYSGTLGRFRFAPPVSPLRSDGDALRVLTGSVTAQVRALDPAEKEALFLLLRREKDARLRGDGAAFFDAAHEVFTVPAASPGLRRAANEFLEAWGQYFNDPKTPTTRARP